MATPLSLSLDELKARPARTLAVTMECAGNGRALTEPRALSQPWLLEAVGTAEWTGTPLAPILDEAGLDAEAIELVFTGLDRGVQGEVEHAYERSLPVAEALRDEVLLAYAINGQPLPPQHGFPVRLLVPSWYGMTHVKWLRSITAVDEPFRGWQQDVAYRLRQSEDEQGTPVTRILPRALMAPPGIPDFLSRTRFVAAGPTRARGPRLVGHAAGRARRGEHRRRRDLGRRRARAGRVRRSRGRAGATSGTRRPASTCSAAARPTPRGARSRPSRSGTSTASATTSCSACASPSAEATAARSRRA